MRIALIIPDEFAAIAGRTLAMRQLDYALAAGAERIIAVGNGAAPQMIALRHAAERAGARFMAVAGSQALLGTMGTADELLIIAPGLLVEEEAALAAFDNGPVALTFPASAGVAAGFERIDGDNAWAGVALIPGGLVERLAALPADVDPASALLRIALQGRVPVRVVDGVSPGAGGWCMMHDDALAQGRAWLQRHERTLARGEVSGWVARFAIRHFGLPLLRRDRAETVLLAVFGLMVTGACALAAFGMGGAGLFVLGAAVLPARLQAEIERLRHIPFGMGRGLVAVTAWAFDLAMGAVLATAMPGDMVMRLFVAAVFVLSLRLSVPARWPRAVAWLADRAVIALLLGAAAVAGGLAHAPMVGALALLAAQLAWRNARTGGKPGNPARITG